VKAGADVIVVDGMQGGRRDAGRVHRARRHPDAAATRSPSTRCRSSACTAGAADRLRRDPHRSRRRQGARPRRRRRLDRDFGAHRHGRQRPASRRRVPRDRKRGRLLRRLAGRPRPRGHLDAGRRARARFDPVLGGRRIANYLRVLTLEAQTLARACGKSPRPQPRAGRPRRAHRRGRGRWRRSRSPARTGSRATNGDR
jgi:hypothetical protein